ncbi:9940_t:CDS:2 [Paraglomus occultum]|uniref:9940_t:CDS:1 n=1 Tax=Paraglomus occultum TaxID=144539 RepID=A0A9N9AVX5_9GLOM|nr:9940_t:CDS:2 [Paraglomus occultum]
MATAPRPRPTAGTSDGTSNTNSLQDETNRSGVPSYENKPPPPIPPFSTTGGGPVYADKLGLAAKQATIAEEYPAIINMSKEELEELLSSDVVFDAFFEQLEQVRNMMILQDEMRMQNELLAKKTLSREQELIQLRESIHEHEDKVREIYSTLQEKLKKQQEALQRFTPELLIAKLKSESQSCDELSEQVANSFLEGDLEVDAFLKGYRELRKG